MTADTLRADDGSIKGIFAFAEDLTVQGDWDPYRLEQVLTNLLTNAVRYAPGAPVHVCLKEQEGRAVLTVRDHGPGIAPHALERIFDRFERLGTVC